jgi:hypothetical protein
MMWDQPDFPLVVDPGITLFDYGRDISGSRSHVRKRRFLRYLPLSSGDEYITGLTVYTSSGSILVLEAHFGQRSLLSGLRSGCPQYFPFQLKECIAYAWLRIYDIDSLALNQRSLVVSYAHLLYRSLLTPLL